jgi:hypothetical protein
MASTSTPSPASRAESRRERLDGALVALSFDEDDGLHVPIVTE